MTQERPVILLSRQLPETFTAALGQLGAAGLDVFEYEPQVTPGLLAFDNVTLLPHIGSATAECRTDMALRALANIRHYLAEGQPVDHCG